MDEAAITCCNICSTAVSHTTPLCALPCESRQGTPHKKFPMTKTGDGRYRSISRPRLIGSARTSFQRHFRFGPEQSANWLSSFRDVPSAHRTTWILVDVWVRPWLPNSCRQFTTKWDLDELTCNQCNAIGTTAQSTLWGFPTWAHHWDGYPGKRSSATRPPPGYGTHRGREP